ncbi:MAG: SpoVA/SpoVAEb family sporulation membrane protein [Clostridia bacterium]|nr:SpoVA/SpoVAEb family sporulation membrane protein [Clostridia bacterium]
MVKKASPATSSLKNCLFAFLTGGSICCFAEGITIIIEKNTSLSSGDVKLLVLIIIIGLTALFTGLGKFDKLANLAGAGTMVPITGFANSIVSPSMEFSREGRIPGTGAQMFRLAGPVIVYGCSAASVYGLILYLTQ